MASPNQHQSIDGDPVVVYSFCVYDIQSRGMAPGRYKATRGAIAAMGGARVLEGTAEEVAADQLDAQGRYRRVATGWGELA